MDSIITRKFRDSDLEDIKRIGLTVWKITRYHAEPKLNQKAADRYWYDMTIANCKNEDVVTIVVELDNKVVGFIQLAEKRNLSERFNIKYGSIALIGVDVKYQGKRIGQRLVGEAVKYFRENGFVKVDVTTDMNNFSAIRMYEKNGFVVIHRGLTLTLDIS